jgi:hypothetical protein
MVACLPLPQDSEPGPFQVRLFQKETLGSCMWTLSAHNSTLCLSIPFDVHPSHEFSSYYRHPSRSRSQVSVRYTPVTATPSAWHVPAEYVNLARERNTDRLCPLFTETFTLVEDLAKRPTDPHFTPADLATFILHEPSTADLANT